MRFSFPAISINQNDKDMWLKQLTITVNNILNGKLNTVGDITLTPGSLTTVVLNEKCGGNSMVLLMPKTANAAAEVPSMYVSPVLKGSFTINHNNSAITDRDFSYVILG